ncbi:MAG: prepilin-type N-terminal cleavage/methylation domain-containing protein [Gemmatimonadota bacterium]|nr:prepilin-type N-terminal cleavage/methylation domain-containing protein [Gemmatimonadota bacterium]
MVKNEKGMTLPEIMVALMLLTFGIMGYVNSSGKTTQLLGNADRSATAAMFGQGYIDYLRSRGCASTVTGTQTIDTYYELDWTAAYNADSSYKSVFMEVTYRTTPTTSRTDTLEALVPC